jgi:hypothetical protein
VDSQVLEGFGEDATEFAVCVNDDDVWETKDTEELGKGDVSENFCCDRFLLESSSSKTCHAVHHRQNVLCAIILLWDVTRFPHVKEDHAEWFITGEGI